jgi:hypothetical protein
VLQKAGWLGGIADLLLLAFVRLIQWRLRMAKHETCGGEQNAPKGSRAKTQDQVSVMVTMCNNLHHISWDNQATVASSAIDDRDTVQ